MKNLIIALVVIAIAVAGVGYWRGWYTFGDKQHPIVFDKDKFKKDKEAWKTGIADKYKSLKTKIAGKKDKIKESKGEEKARLEKELEDLEKREKAIEAKLKQIDSTEVDETFNDLKMEVTKDLEETGKDDKDKEKDKDKGKDKDKDK
jgi:hypothetical protein